MHRRPGAAERLLDPGESLVDARPARADEVDEQPEVLDARVSLRRELGLEPVQASGDLRGHAPDLCQLSPDGACLVTHTCADGCSHLIRKLGLDPGGDARELAQLPVRALEHRGDVDVPWALGLRFGEALAGAVKGELVHRRATIPPGPDDSGALTPRLLAHFTTHRAAQGDRVSFIPILVLLLAAMWLLVIRPQRARQKAAQQTLNALVPGTEVLTAGGLYGTVRKVDDDDVHVEIAPDTVVRVARRAIASVIEPEDDELGELERAQREAEAEVVAARETADR